jgi:hypothetical protein
MLLSGFFNGMPMGGKLQIFCFLLLNGFLRIKRQHQNKNVKTALPIGFPLKG